jgi:hypothetical protein
MKNPVKLNKKRKQQKKLKTNESENQTPAQKDTINRQILRTHPPKDSNTQYAFSNNNFNIIRRPFNWQAVP